MQEPESQMQRLADKIVWKLLSTLGLPIADTSVGNIVKFNSLDVWQVNPDNFSLNGLRHLSQLLAPPLHLTPSHTAELLGDNMCLCFCCSQPQPSIFTTRTELSRATSVCGAAELWAGCLITGLLLLPSRQIPTHMVI